MFEVKKISRRILLATTFTVVALFLVVMFIFKDQDLDQGLNLALDDFKNIKTDEQVGSFGSPLRLRIPVINVDSAVELVGTTQNGNMDTPKKPENVAWYQLGSKIGENGSAVITGHYGKWKNGRGSAFDDLSRLQKGDRVYVEDDKGVTISFVVSESRSYDPNADTADVFTSNDAKAHLNLITCEGIWNKESDSYSSRLVVFTDKETECKKMIFPVWGDRTTDFGFFSDN